MSNRPVSRNNIIAGAFIVLAVVLAVVLSITLSGLEDRLVSTRVYVVRFSLADGTAGLETGSKVNVGGQKVGRVASIQIVSEGDRPAFVDVRVKIRADLKLYRDTIAYLVQPLLGGLATINIPNAGTPDGAPLGGGSVIPGQIAVPAFLAQAGYGPDQANQVRTMIRDAQSIIERVDRMVARVESELDTTIGLIRTAAEDAQDITGRLRERTPEWTAQVDTVLTQVSTGATEFSALSTDLRARSEEARKILETVQGALDRNTGRFDTIIQNAESITTRFDQETMQLVQESLDRVAKGAESFSTLAERAERFLAEESPSLRKTVANLRLTSDQLKLAAVEIRTKPWLLLYTPKTKELESEYILQTARSYAAAVSDLRAASESLEAAAGADGSPLASERESLMQMTERLGEAFKAYEQAEQKLLDLLIEKNP